ncbi:MAG: hypothetical protein HXS48_02505 [Theionarchaea archaeon]|nr:hypothetical protein [Theionarchaea archaeon]
MSTTTEEIKTLWSPYPDPDPGEGPICVVCGNPIEIKSYSGTLKEDHSVNIFILAGIGDKSLPHSLEAHGDCLPFLRDKLIEKNKGWKWI